MKIERVEALPLTTGGVFVRVRTSDGVEGIGECSPMHRTVVAGFVNDALAPLLVGQDPAQIDKLWHRMLHATYKLGVQGAQPEAIAGVDIALWDIAGKVAGRPIVDLLGGRHRDRQVMYASLGGGARFTVAEMVAQVERALAQGFRAVKIRMDYTVANRDVDPDKDVAMFEACRAVCGPDVALMFDANNGYSVPVAQRVGRRLTELGCYHFEEPVAQYDYDGIARVADALDVPVAAGEHEYTLWQFRDLLERARVDVAQPDVVKCAGISELRRIAALVAAYDRHLVPHQTQPSIGAAASLSVIAATYGADRPQEWTGPRPELDELFVEPWTFADGCLHIPDRPGLGLELDDSRLRAVLA